MCWVSTAELTCSAWGDAEMLAAKAAAYQSMTARFA
jgi:hypothetical protein